MATRQYIGARYVPKFYTNSVDGSTAWESNVVYDPLIYVTLSNGHMYISKKQVPATVGVPSENTEYWLDVGSYNGISEELQQEIDEIVANIGDMDDLPYPIFDNIVDTLSALKTDVDAALESASDRVLKRKYAIITDSYGGTFGGTITPYTTRFASLMGLTEGVNFCKAHLDGAGFISDGRLFTTPLQQLANNMPGTMTTADVTDILVLGGCNDSSITSGLGNGISDFIATAAQLFPNARVHVGLIGGINTMAGRRRLFRQVLPYYSQAATYGHKACFIPNLQYVMTHKELFQSGDTVHPNQLGMNFIATALASAMSDGFTASYSTDATFTKDSAFDTGTMTSGHVDVCNGRTTLLCNTISLTYAAAQSKSGNLVIGTLNNANIIGWIDVWFPVQVTYSGGSDGTVSRTEMAAISDNTLYIIMSAPTNFKNLGIARLSADFTTLLC